MGVCPQCYSVIYIPRCQLYDDYLTTETTYFGVGGILHVPDTLVSMFVNTGDGNKGKDPSPPRVDVEETRMFEIARGWWKKKQKTETL